MFNRLGQFNNKISPIQCHFYHCVLFLDHVLPADGISASLEKVKKVRLWPILKEVNEDKPFLGHTSYYRLHINHFMEKG